MTALLRLGTLMFVLLGLIGVGSAASAERLDQAATATPTPGTGASPTPVPCVTPTIGIQLVLENPSPGDTLLTGTQVVMNGIAYDTGATEGTGIASVAIYLGDRDSGGISLGVAQLGQPNPLAAPGSQFANAGFTLRTPRLPAGSGAKTIFVYARSIVGNAEAVLQVPIFLNAAPTPVKGQVPTPVLPPPPTCTPTPTPTATTPPTSAPAAATSTPITGGVATPTPGAPLTPLPAAPAPTPQLAAAPTLAPVAPAPTPAPAVAQATAPRAGGIPSELGLLLLGAGGAIVGAGFALRRLRR